MLSQTLGYLGQNADGTVLDNEPDVNETGAHSTSGLSVATTIITEAEVFEWLLKKQEAKETKDIRGMKLSSYKDHDS